MTVSKEQLKALNIFTEADNLDDPQQVIAALYEYAQELQDEVEYLQRKPPHFSSEEAALRYLSKYGGSVTYDAPSGTQSAGWVEGEKSPGAGNSSPLGLSFGSPEVKPS